MLGGSPRGPQLEVRMAERRLPIPERPWHQSKSGCWSLSLGVRGLKVRVEQQRPGGTFQRVYRVGRRVTYATLGTTDRREARRLAIEFLRALETGKKVNLAEPLALKHLWDRYGGGAQLPGKPGTATAAEAGSSTAVYRPHTCH